MAQPAPGAVVEQWVRRFNGPDSGIDGARTVVLDSDGNVVVTGRSGDSNGNNDWYTAKYAAADGSLLWEHRYDESANLSLGPEAVAVDSGGNVAVTGYSESDGNYDYYTAKYAAADGSLLWEQRNNEPDRGGVLYAMAVDDEGNVIVTGYSYSWNERIGGYYTAKYAATDGALIWEKHYTGPDNGYGYASAVAVDALGNPVVTGYSYSPEGGVDFYTAKYASADGRLLWERRYNGPGSGYDYANAVAVDVSGNVVVTGVSQGINPNFDYYTAKYAAADGAVLWEQRYDGPANYDDYPSAAAVDGSGNVVVTGYSYRTDGGTDFYTAKYAAADGRLLWERRYSGPGNGHDYANDVAVDVSGNAVVTGYVFNGHNYDYYTAKYAAADGALLWEQGYNGPANGDDSAIGLALTPNGSVVVTGTSSRDFATILYRESFPPIITCPADVVANATSSTGAVVHFTPTATDDSGLPPTITCAPPSGSVFPIGRTTVTCTATDGDGLSSICAFIVTVPGARGVKQSVLAELVALRATVMDRDDGRKLNEAIAHLTQSLAAEFWVDETHLERKHGGKVFLEEKEAVRNLCDLIQSRKSHLANAVRQVFVDQLIQADRLLASVAIEEAIAAGVSAKKIEQAQQFLARGDVEAVGGKCANGIEEYRKAWKRAARAKVSSPVRLANGHVRLEIAGEAGDRFTIQSSTNLKDWTTLGTRTANAEGVVTFDDADAGPHRTRFYRLIAE